MDFKYEEKTYFELWEHEFSQFVSDFYGRPWSMQQGMCLGQNTYQTANIPEGECVGKVDAWLNLPYDPDAPYAAMHFERDHYVWYAAILDDLHAKGVIPAGNYLIKVWW